jgi:hypothetical protein
VRRTVPPSAEIEEQIDRLLAVGVGENPRESLSELAKLGARLIIQRAVEDEFDAWLGRARYERRPDHQRGLRNYWRLASVWCPKRFSAGNACQQLSRLAARRRNRSFDATFCSRESRFPSMSLSAASRPRHWPDEVSETIARARKRLAPEGSSEGSDSRPSTSSCRPTARSVPSLRSRPCSAQPAARSACWRPRWTASKTRPDAASRRCA